MNRATVVEQMSYDEVSLISSQKWLRSFVKYNGLYQGLLIDSAKESRISTIARYVFTFSTILLVSSIGAFQFVQILITMWNREKMVVLIPQYLNWCLYAGFISALHIFSIRHKIVRLFKDWKTIEMELKCLNSSKTRKIIKIHNASSFITLIMTSASIFVWNHLEPDRPMFLSHYSILREYFSLPLLSILNSISAYFAGLWYYSLCEMHPTIFFYHVGCAVENLNLEWLAQGEEEKVVHLIWERYERILLVIDRANDLFGFVIGFNDFVYFFVTCLMTFFIVTLFENSPALSLIFLLTMIALVFRTAFVNYLLSHVYLSRGKLERSITSLLSKKWHSLSESDRNLLFCFLSTLQKDDMVVCPLNLYTVKRGNILNMLTFIITYVIILLQAGG